MGVLPKLYPDDRRLVAPYIRKITPRAALQLAGRHVHLDAPGAQCS
jgi:hypothetical protein